MTVDYRANDPATGRTVVLTVPSEESAESPILLQRFYREARAAGSLQHPNIVAIYDLGVDRGNPFITRELLEGCDLGELAGREKEKEAQTPQASAKLLDYLLQACRALSYAHQRGVIHRDVRPQSIFVMNNGTAKLTNFVHARLPEAFTPVSAGIPTGTFDYMSPEQVRGGRVDAGGDIWAVGCTLYELLTYKKPFQTENVTAFMIAVMSQEPTPIHELRPDLPTELDDVLRRALKKDRTERYKSIDALVKDLERLVRQMQAAGPAA